MSNIDKQALRESAEKATKGDWWSDVVENDGEYGEGGQKGISATTLFSTQYLRR
ncbi:ead/Ea22-like family protein [Enterobacter kobei]